MPVCTVMKTRNQAMHWPKMQPSSALSREAQIQSSDSGKITASPDINYQAAVAAPYRIVNRYWYTMCFQLIKI